MAEYEQSDKEFLFSTDLVPFVWFQLTAPIPYTPFWSLSGRNIQISLQTEMHMIVLIYDIIPRLHRSRASLRFIPNLSSSVFWEYSTDYTDNALIPLIVERCGRPPVQNVQFFLHLLLRYCFIVAYWGLELHILGNLQGAILAVIRIYFTLKELKRNGYIDERIWEALPEWTLYTDSSQNQ